LRLLVVGAVATVVIGFVVGFALGGRSGDDALTASAPVSSTTTLAPPTSASTTTTTDTSASSTTSSSPPTSTTTVPTTVAPTTTAPTTVVAPTSTTPVTVAVPTTVATTVAPSRVVVSHATDGSGRLIIPRHGSANLVITNQGGLAQQWLVTGTGFTTVGASQGTLGPGQTVTVTLVAPPGELPSGEINGTVSVLGAVNPTVAFVIPPG
jgi:hypothetical protein